MMNIYYAKINDDDTLGLQAVSLVLSPAVKKSFICMEEEQPLVTEVKMSGLSKHIVTGVALRANYPIYRKLSSTGEPYYLVYTPEVIEQMVERFSSKQLNNMVDLQHDGKMVKGVVMVESYIKDVNRGINPVGFEDIENGSWFVSYKIQDENLWNEIVSSGNLSGFSIESLVELCPSREEASLEEYIPQSVEELIEMILKENE